MNDLKYGDIVEHHHQGDRLFGVFIGPSPDREGSQFVFVMKDDFKTSDGVIDHGWLNEIRTVNWIKRLDDD